MLFLSPRNSDDAQYSVMEQAESHKFLCSASFNDRVKKLIRRRPKSSKTLQYVVPEQKELLKDESVANFPYERILEEARSEPLVCLHTSRSVVSPYRY